MRPELFRESLTRLHRRDLFSFAARGIGGTALAWLLARRDARAEPVASEAHPPAPHFEPKAKRVVHFVLCGGLSQVDSFDFKPALARHHGQPLGAAERPDVFFGQVGLLRKNDWEFQQRGQSGLWISDLFPRLAELADELTVIRSMFADTSNHTPATFQENTGFRLNGFPVVGAWASYGLGCETDDLPAFVVIPDSRGYPAGGSINWTSGFLPARHQGVVIRGKGTPIEDITPSRPIPEPTEFASRQLLGALNQEHLRRQGGGDLLAARIRSYELAAKMQLAVPAVADLASETNATHELYGLNRAETSDFGRGCLLTRRLLERGVRFIQVFSGGAFGSPRINWDGHENMRQNHGQEAARIDQPIAALIQDLRQRGMLRDTLLLFTSEFGRTPFTQSADGVLGEGRDHNQYGFSVWMCGAGLRAGIAYGATDDVGLHAVENRVHWNDFHATVLHLCGIDHEKLTYYHNGIGRRLTDVGGQVIEPILS
ncbi:MAG: DUF1501 domain-containing protein [Planctomycetes bacterium]|nr:DUF1501 domain-containing protein [Planctomycetota bacterium]